MITKPEDVKPYKKYDSTWTIPELYISATQCAQIARAYAKTKLEAKKYRKVDISANQAPYPDEAWEAKFKEWEQL